MSSTRPPQTSKHAKRKSAGTELTTSFDTFSLCPDRIKGHINHTLFWEGLAPTKNGGGRLNDGELS